MGYRLTAAAEADIVTLYVEGAEFFGLHQADAYHEALGETFERLAEMPRMARERMEMSPPVRVHPFGRHLIIYREIDADILIIRVRHAREDWANNDPSGQDRQPND